MNETFIHIKKAVILLTPLYKNEQLESRISQWRLLFIGCKTKNSHKTLLTFFNKKLNTTQKKFGAQKGCVLGVECMQVCTIQDNENAGT